MKPLDQHFTKKHYRFSDRFTDNVMQRILYLENQHMTIAFKRVTVAASILLFISLTVGSSSLSEMLNDLFFTTESFTETYLNSIFDYDA